MGRGGPRKGRRGGAGGKSSSAPDKRREPRSRGAATEAAPGPVRLLLTRLLRDGTIWNVYVASSAPAGEQARTELEFEGTGAAQSVRCIRRVDGPLLDALYSGAPVSRSQLQDELELALAAAAAVDSAESGSDDSLSESR
jgi:hypothetical protein